MYKVKGFVLRSKDLGDSLRSLTLYTDLLGRLPAVVKLKAGDFPLKFDLFSLSQFFLREKAGRFEVVKAKLIKPHFPKTAREFFYRERISKLLASYQVAPSQRVFDLFSYYLSVTSEFKLAYVMFLLKFTFLEGVFPILSKCVLCGSKEIESFSLDKGGVLCSRCGEGEFPWSYRDSRLSLKLLKAPFSSQKGSYPGKRLDRIKTVFERHLSYRLG